MDAVVINNVFADERTCQPHITEHNPFVKIQISSGRLLVSSVTSSQSNQTARFDEFLIKLKLKCLAKTLAEGKKQSFQFNYAINIMIKDIKQRPETKAR